MEHMRYFMFFYKTADLGYGNIVMSKNKFPSKKEIDKAIFANCAKSQTVILTGWQEFSSEEDCKDYLYCD